MIYISLLRGINVSRQKSIKMHELRETYSKLDFHNITTYLQSGNVIFETQLTNPSGIEQLITNQIKHDFGYDIPVLVLNAEYFDNVYQNNPLYNDASKDQSFFHVTFLASKPNIINLDEIEAKQQEGEEFFIENRTVYLYCPNGYGKTKLTNNFFESKLKVSATTRNWKTITELVKLSVAK